MNEDSLKRAQLLQQVERLAANEKLLHATIEGLRTDRDALREECGRIKMEAVHKAADIVEKTLTDDFAHLCKQFGIEPQAAADAPASVRIAATLKWALELVQSHGDENRGLGNTIATLEDEVKRLREDGARLLFLWSLMSDPHGYGFTARYCNTHDFASLVTLGFPDTGVSPTINVEVDLMPDHPDDGEDNEGRTFRALIDKARAASHHENCDALDRGPDGIVKPCNCKAASPGDDAIVS